MGLLLVYYQSTNRLIDVSHSFFLFSPQLFLFTADCSLPFPLFKVKMPNQFFLWPCPSLSLLQIVANLSPTVTDMMNLSLAITSIHLPEWAVLLQGCTALPFPAPLFQPFHMNVH